MGTRKLRINLFEQINRFQEIEYSQKFDLRSSHTSLYYTLLGLSNKMFWTEWIKCPIDMMLILTGIGSRTTFYNACEDLKKWELIDYIPGKNQISSAKYHVKCLPKNEQTTAPSPERATEHPTVLLTELLTVQAPRLLPEHVYKVLSNKLIKVITENIKDITEGDFDFQFINNKINKKNSTDLQGEIATLWDLWIDMRKKKGKPLVTKQGREKQYEYLFEICGGNYQTACRILKQSIANEWIKLYPIDN